MCNCLQNIVQQYKIKVKFGKRKIINNTRSTDVYVSCTVNKLEALKAFAKQIACFHSGPISHDTGTWQQNTFINLKKQKLNQHSSSLIFSKTNNHYFPHLTFY